MKTVRSISKFWDDSGHAEIPHSDGKRLSGRARRSFQGMENNANPWNMNNGERQTADIDVQVVDPSDPFDHEYFDWVVPDHLMTNQKFEATKLLQRAGVDFAILGPLKCTGDSARRSGNEYLFKCLQLKT